MDNREGRITGDFFFGLISLKETRFSLEFWTAAKLVPLSGQLSSLSKSDLETDPRREAHNFH